MKSLFQIITSFIALLIISPLVWAQSAEQEALTNLINHAWSIKKTNPDQAFAKANQALQTAESIDDPTLVAKSLYVLASIKFEVAEFQQAFEYGERAKEQYQANQSIGGEANALDLLATITLNSEDFTLAAQYYQEEIELILANDDLSPFLASTYFNYASLFQDMSFYAYALDYYDRAIRYAPDNDDVFLNRIKLAKSQIFFEQNQLDKANQHAQEAYLYFADQEEKSSMAKCLNVQGALALFEERFVDATPLFSEALSLILNDSQLDLEAHINYLVNLSKSYLGENKPKASLQAVKKAYLLAQTELKTPGSELICVEQLYEYYENQGMLDTALIYVDIARKLESDIYDNHKNLSVLLADTKLKVDENTRRLLTREEQLSRAIDRQSNLYIGVIALGFILMVLGGAFWQYGQKKKTQVELMLEKEKNQEQLLQGVIKEQELKSISYIIEGQESEKKRVAEELHDGLGGTLAAVRIALEQFRRQLKSWTEIDLQDFDYAFDLLREATDDVRRISHDMGAVRLKHGGLVTALEDMCRNLSRHQSFVANLDTEGIEMLRINSEVEFHLYRIAQELFQNIIKHAQANKVKIQLTNAGGRLHLYMWDDGKGFNVEEVEGGMGMQNLRIRTQQLNGKIHIDSTIGKGTYTHISLPV